MLFRSNDIDLAECYTCWENECNERFTQLKANEEELNRIFIDIYGLQDELTPEVEDKDVTVRKADLQRDIMENWRKAQVMPDAWNISVRTGKYC